MASSAKFLHVMGTIFFFMYGTCSLTYNTCKIDLIMA